MFNPHGNDMSWNYTPNDWYNIPPNKSIYLAQEANNTKFNKLF